MQETGVSLGGGCLRGAAHIGALRELIKHGTKITHVAGTSAGAVVGGLYASGLDPDQMEKALESLSIRKHLDFGFNRKGLLKGDQIYQTLLKLTEGKHFSDLDIPLAVVCVDLHARELTIVKKGEVAKALSASMALPGIFSPIEIDGRLLVDGYILNNNPSDVVKALGAKHVTAIRVLSSFKQNKSLTNSLSSVIKYMEVASSIQTDKLLKNHADVIIDIDLVDVGRFEPKSISTVIQRGQIETRKALAIEKQTASIGRVIYMEQWLKRTTS